MKKGKIDLTFFECRGNISKSFGDKDPGVAKFGIALEWGSRGLEFESRHSDQKYRVLPLFMVKYGTFFVFIKVNNFEKNSLMINV